MSENEQNNGSPITSFDAIQELCTKPFPVRFKLHGHVCEMSARNLTPTETELVRTQMEELFPPIKKGRIDAEDRLDYTDPNYLAKRQRVEREVRAQIVYWACPAIQAKKPELVDARYAPANRGAIKEFVQGLLSDDVLETLQAAILEKPERLASAVNFY